MRRGLAAFLVLLPITAWGQDAAGHIDLTGQVERPISLSVADLAGRPSVEVHAVREGGAAATYAGPLLWPILTDAHLVDAPGRNTHLQHVVVARGADGYAVAVAIGEVDPGFEAKPVIIALQQDGKPLARPRLVVPGDHKPGRAVRDLVALEVR